MSFINKVKNFFYEDVEEDDEEFEAREAAKREEKLRKREEKELRRLEQEEKRSKPIVQEANNDLSERELFKSERTFNFPMDIDEDIFDITETMNLEEEQKEESRKQVKEEKNLYARPATRTVTPISTRTTYKEGPVKTDEPKKFHPSPVVSPVYGVLDKNYTVEDVVDKNLSKTKEFSLEKKTVDFDSVRNRAYKELDDEIEKTLTGNKDIFYNLEDEKKDDENEVIDDLLDAALEKNEPEEEVKITYEGEEEQENIEEAKPVEAEQDEDDIDFEVPDVTIPTTVEKKTTRSKRVAKDEDEQEKEDLFNLIDNMYNDEEDEEEED